MRLARPWTLSLCSPADLTTAIFIAILLVIVTVTLSNINSCSNPRRPLAGLDYVAEEELQRELATQGHQDAHDRPCSCTRCFFHILMGLLFRGPLIISLHVLIQHY